MKAINDLGEPPYVFWLFAWQHKPISPNFRFGPQYSRCEIAAEEFVILDVDGNDSFRLLLSNVQKCELYDKRWTGSASMVNLRIQYRVDEKFEQQTKQINEVYLCPAHVFKHYYDTHEMQNMCLVIESLRMRQSVSIEKNPYHRQLIRQGQPKRITEREWNPNLPPGHYSTAPSLKRFLTIAPLVLLAVMIALLSISALVYYLVTNVF